MKQIEKEESVILWDDFKNGLHVDSKKDKWTKGEYGGISFDDAVIYKLEDSLGIRVVPRGRNCKTGEPAFSVSVGQDENGIPGSLDHVFCQVKIPEMSVRIPSFCTGNSPVLSGMGRADQEAATFCRINACSIR